MFRVPARCANSPVRRPTPPIIGGVIRLLHWAPESDQATEHEIEELDSLRRSGWVWLDLSGPDSARFEQLAYSFGIGADHVQEAVTDTRLTMVDEGEGYLYTVLFGFATGEDSRLVATRLAVFVGKDFLVTVSGDELPGVQWVQSQMASGVSLPNPTPMGLLAFLGLAGIRRLQPLVQELEDQIDFLEELAIEADPRTITQAYALRRDVIILRRLLTPQRNIYAELAGGWHTLVDEESVDDLGRVVDLQDHTMTSLEAALSLLESVLEIHQGAVADQTNEIVRVLTVFSAVMLPLGLVAGIWGMNFDRIPGATQRWGFFILVGAMALIAVGLWAYFSRRGFVGAPRLRDLPKAAGLGLIQVGVAPIRVVAGGIESTMRFVGLRESENGGE